MDFKAEVLLRKQLVALLEGGFAPNVELLREFNYKKAGIILEGLHFSAWILLGHIKARQKTLLDFIKDPEKNAEVWLDAHWPENYEPENESEWNAPINEFETDLQEFIRIIKDPKTDLFEIQKNGKTFSWAAIALLHHNGYHIGQLKSIGRQLGVW